MSKMKKLLSVVLAVVLALSAFSVLGSAAKTAYKTVAELEALDAYSPYGQVTRLSVEERTSIVFDALDNLLPGLGLNMGELFNVLGLSVTIDLSSVDRLCYSIDSIVETFDSTLGGIAMGIVDLGILEELEVGTWSTGMSRSGTANFTILKEIIEFLSNNTGLISSILSDGLDLGIISLGDMSAIEDIIGNIPGLIKGMVYPMIERWDDTVAVIKELDKSIAGTSENYNSVEAVANWRVKKLFSDNMSITTVKYDANGNMTSEHTGMPIVTSLPSVTDNSPRCVYVVNGTTPGSVMTVYHIVDEAEAETLAETPDKVNGSPAAYTYFKEAQTYVMAQEVEGSSTYVWQATDEFGNKWSMKWYNDDSQWLADYGITGDSFDLQSMSLAQILYTFVPVVFEAMAPTVLNGSVKKILAEFLGAKFTYVGDVGSDAVAALGNDTFFTEEQGEYLWEWSNYEIIGGTHYYRYEDQIYVGDLSHKNNYFDIINWDYEITGDFLDEFIPENGGSSDDTLLMNFNNFLVKVADEALVESASTVDTISGFEAEWVRPNLDELKGDNSKLVTTLKTIAQAVIGLAPQHVFGDDYKTNERCYVELMLAEDNDTVLTGIAAHLVNMIMPSMSLPGKSNLIESGAKVGAILAAVVREFAAYLAPEYNFDALIYTDFGTTEADNVKSFVSGKDAGYWFDVILTMGINVGFEYLRAFADMGEGTEQWNSFVSYSGYGVDGKTYAAGTTQAELNAEWEGMLDYILDWALSNEFEWTWAMTNLVDAGAEINLATAQDPWVKLDTILNGLLPADEILNVDAENCETELEQLLRYDLILALVELRWDDLLDVVKIPDGFVRNTNVLDQLAAKLKGIVNYLFKKVGGGSYELIPSVISDFDSLANQDNLATMVTNLVGVLYTATSNETTGLLRTAFPFVNFFLGWTTDPQEVADPEIWTAFRDGNDYAFQYNVSKGGSIDADNTILKILNNSAGMLEKHRNSSVTDHAYDIQIKSVTSDATVNKLTFTYGDGNGLISPYETLDLKIGGTFNGDESATITIAYDYVGKDGEAIGGTQYTSYTVLFSNHYEDANLSGRFDEDDDKDYTGTDDYGRYQFTKDIYDTVVNYQARIFYVAGTTSSPSKSLGTIAAPDYDEDCDGNKTYYNLDANASKYFAFRAADSDAGWKSTMSKDGGDTYGYLYKAANGTTAETEIPYGAYYMGRIAVAYGSDNKQYEITFVHYNDYNIYDIYAENQWNGYNANQGVDAAIYNEYNAAWKDIVKYATYPMMTTANPDTPAEADYVANIQPYIPDAIERYEAAKEAYETALAEAQASASADASLPSHIVALQEAIDDDFVNGKEINFQDYEFYEYFNYDDVKQDAEDLYRSYLAPEVMDTYYILGSGIREAELDNVIAAEANPYIAAGISASRLMNDQAAIDESQRAHDEWTMPVTTKLHAEDLTSRLTYYKQFLAANAEGTEHLYFLNQEIAHVEAQGLDPANYTEDSWANYEEKLAEAKAVAAGDDEFSSFNSRIYDVKYNLMVAYKNLLTKEASLIENSGTAELEGNIEVAEEIFASLEAGDGEWALAADYEGEADDAYAQLISALGYYYVGEDGVEYNLYEDSAYEYRDNDRPANQNNQAKVNASNDALVAAIANFETAAAPSEPNTLVLNENAPFEAIIDYANCGDYTATIYGFDTIGINMDVMPDGTIADFVTTAYGDEYLEIITPDCGMETTGTIINVLDENNEVVESYVYVLFGDMDQDGWVSGSDKYVAEMYDMTLEGIETLEVFMAGDVDGDAWVSGSDGYMMELFDTMLEFPTQAEIGEVNVNNYYELIV